MNRLLPASIRHPVITPQEIAECVEGQAKIRHPVSSEEARRMLEYERDNVAYFVNDIYQVARRVLPPGHLWNRTEHEIIHLNIRRRDGKPIFRDWRHFQQIKNELVGEEAEAVEIYPAESRLNDTTNKYHLFCFPVGIYAPFGMPWRDVQDDLGDKRPGYRQRKLST